MADHNDFGKLAEEKSSEFLIKKGYKIIAQNWRWQKAEIDIIAQKDNKIIVLEVKARTTNIVASPEEAVNKKKIKLLISAADQFMQEKELNFEVRFDVISVLIEAGELKINHIKSAFESIDAN